MGAERLLTGRIQGSCGSYKKVVENAGGTKNTKMKIKLRVKITGRVKAPIKSMLSPVLFDFASTNQAVPSSRKPSPPCFIGIVMLLNATLTSQTFRCVTTITTIGSPHSHGNRHFAKVDGSLAAGHFKS